MLLHLMILACHQTRDDCVILLLSICDFLGDYSTLKSVYR